MKTLAEQIADLLLRAVISYEGGELIAPTVDMFNHEEYNLTHREWCGYVKEVEQLIENLISPYETK